MGKEKKIFFFYMLIKFLYLIIKKKNYLSKKIWKKGAYEIDAVIYYNFNCNNQTSFNRINPY